MAVASGTVEPHQSKRGLGPKVLKLLRQGSITNRCSRKEPALHPGSERECLTIEAVYQSL